MREDNLVKPWQEEARGKEKRSLAIFTVEETM
jgi:hypothetical protein